MKDLAPCSPYAGTTLKRSYPLWGDPAIEALGKDSSGNPIAQLSPRKPKMVFFQPPRLHNSPHFKEFYNDKAVKCLSEFFQVVIINQDCDYAEICDIHRPEISLFESSNPEMKDCRIRISNTSSYPEIPKVGLMWMDVFTPARSAFLADMDKWGVETFFTGCATMAEYIPEIADQLFYWPPFVDTNLFRDYGARKTIPVLLIGDFDRPSLEYSWRRSVKEPLRKNYPCLTVPHPWYGPSYQVYGEEYARLINASMVVPTCGAMCKIIVTKHLEIPAAKACLVTERTPAVEACGFMDMENCVFADGSDIVEKLDYLFANRKVLEQITNSGYELVRSRHTATQRPQILQWLQLRQSLKAGQRIVQPNYFADLEIVDVGSDLRTGHIIVGAADRVLLRQGDEKLTAGKYDEAEALYLHCLDYIPYIPEPELRLAVCKLYQGDARAALDWIHRRIKWSRDDYQAMSPDPVEWAYLIIATLCRGNLRNALIFSKYFPLLNHPQLAKARWAVCVLANKQDEAEEIRHQITSLDARRKTIHQLPQFGFYEDVRQLCTMLKACKRWRFATTLYRFIRSSTAASKSRRENKPVGSTGDRISQQHEDQENIAYVLEAMDQMRRSLLRRLRSILKSRAKDFIIGHPQLMTKIKYLVSERLRVQEW
jgi:hypothetical protein